MPSIVSRAFRGLRDTLLRLVVVAVCLVIIGGVGLGFYAYYTRSPQAAKTREKIDETRDRAKAEERRWQDKLDELKAQLKETVDSYSDGKEGAVAVQKRIEAIKQRIAEAQKEFSPEYREKLDGWLKQADESLDAIKKNSGAVGERLKGWWDDVASSLREAKDKLSGTKAIPAEKTPPPPVETTPSQPKR